MNYMEKLSVSRTPNVQIGHRDAMSYYVCGCVCTKSEVTTSDTHSPCRTLKRNNKPIFKLAQHRRRLFIHFESSRASIFFIFSISHCAVRAVRCDFYLFWFFGRVKQLLIISILHLVNLYGGHRIQCIDAQRVSGKMKFNICIYVKLADRLEEI